MKALLVFKLPDDADDFKLAQKATEYMCALHDIKNYVREMIKYASDDYKNKNGLEVLKEIQEFILEQYRDHELE